MDPRGNWGNCFRPNSAVIEFKSFLAVEEYRIWNFWLVGVPKAFLKAKPLEREIYVELPLFPEKIPETLRVILKPLHGLETACREWYETLKWGPPTPTDSKIMRKCGITR